MEDASKYWPVSVAATTLMIVGYFPEFVRLYLERSASGTGIFMWLIWIGSASMSTLYAALSGASVLIVVNCATILCLTVLSALGNAYFSRGPPSRTTPSSEPLGTGDDANSKSLFQVFGGSLQRREIPQEPPTPEAR